LSGGNDQGTLLGLLGRKGGKLSHKEGERGE